MKWLIFAILSFIILYNVVESLPSKEDSSRFKEECRREAGLADTPLADTWDDPKTKCFGACLAKKQGFIIDGKVSAENYIERMKKDIEKLSVCSDKANKETDECEVMYVLAKCMDDLP